MKNKKLLAFALSMAVARHVAADRHPQTPLQQVLLTAPRQKAVPPATIPLSLPWVPVSPLWIQVMFTKSTHS